MNKRYNKVNVLDAAHKMTTAARRDVHCNALYYNKQTGLEEYASGELSYHIDAYIIYYCQEIINQILSLL